MMVDVVKFGQQCQFLPEAIDSLKSSAAILALQDDATSVFATCKEELFAESGNPWRRLDALAEKARLHHFVVHQLFLILCADQARTLYQNAGHSDALYWDSMKDLKYKMEETHAVYGVWGVYCGPWLASLLTMKIVCLGRLQFELRKSEFHYELAGHTLKINDPVITVHIPSFGQLGYEDVLDSYARAAEFYAHLFLDGGVWFRCETWIFYPQVNALLPDGNMKRFSEDFDIVHACIEPDTDDRYRVFMLPPHVPVAEYPANNTLQRRLKTWLLAGNTMGMGFGLFLWKNGRIVPHC